MQVELEYVGKKEPFTFNCTILTRPVEWKFRHRGSRVFAEPAVADEVLKHNPTGFVKKVGMVQEVESAVPVEEPKSGLNCPYCGKNYKLGGRGQYFYDRHVDSCPERILDEPKEEPAGLIYDPLDS